MNDQDRDRVEREIAAPWRQTSSGLDELHRARLASAIEASLDRLDAERTDSIPWRRRTRARVAVFAAVAGLAAVLALVVATRPPSRPPPAREARQIPRDGKRAIGVPAAPVLLTPYLYSGPAADAQALEPSATLVVPAGARARAAIGTRVRLTLVGPGRVSLGSATGDRNLDLTLDGGRLLVDYDGHGGATLRVHSPGAVTTVVGTLFSVEATGARTRVAVNRGQIHTDSDGRLWQIAAGDCWTTGETKVGTIPAELRQALIEHDASPGPPIGEYGILRVGAETPAGADATGVVRLDRRPLGAPPLVARVGAGHHLLGAPWGRTDVELADGSMVRVSSAARAAPPDDGMPAQPDRDRHRRIAPAPGAPGQSGVAASASDAPGAAPSEAATPIERRPHSLDDTYAAAETFMRAGARAEARRALEDVAARDPSGGLGEAALLDLARLALGEGNAGDARRALARLPEPLRDRALAEPADHLRCRADLLLGDTEVAERCLSAFRSRHPDSPHDAEVLSLLASMATGCNQALLLFDEYLRLYPAGPFAAEARRRREPCVVGPSK